MITVNTALHNPGALAAILLPQRHCMQSCWLVALHATEDACAVRVAVSHDPAVSKDM